MNRPLAALFALLLVSAPITGWAETPAGVTRIGVLTDLSGSMANAAGRGSIEAAEMAVEDAMRGDESNVTIVTGDYQSRGDLAQHISEDWIKRQNIDMVVDVPNTVIAAKLQDLFSQQDRLLLSSSPKRVDDAESTCGGHGVFWLTDRDTLANNLIRALKSAGKTRWFILGGDTLSATQQANAIKAAIQAGGGTVAGEAYLGPRMTGIDSVLEQIKPDDVDVIFLAFERADTLFALKNWPKLDKPLPPLALSAVHLSDLVDMKDRDLPPFYTAVSFYWNQDTATRSFSDRFAARNHGAVPTGIHAAVYSAVYHYLRSVTALGQKSADAVLAHMKSQPLQDGFFQGSHIRADGTLTHRIRLLFLKKKDEREGPFDFFQVVRSMPPAEQVVPPVTSCPQASLN